MGSLSQRFPTYSRFLKLYPATYQKEYTGQMLQTLADMLDHADSDAQKRAIWFRAALDLPFSLTKQNLAYAGSAMAHETPGYVKQGSLLGAILLLPFFLALVANGLDKLIYNHNLFHSWLWATTTLFIWVILLPALSLIVSGATFLRWTAQKHHEGKTNSWKLLTDWHHNWMMLAVLILSFGILAMVRFHDSVQCVTGNPVKEARDFHQTLACVRNG